MRVLSSNEVNQIAGGAWWSTENIMAFFQSLTGSGSRTKMEWTNPNVEVGTGYGLGKVLGVGIVAAAAVGVVSAVVGFSALISNSSK